MISAFCGCSYTEGLGLENTKDNPDLWVNRVHSMTLPKTRLINLGQGGNSNEDIFMSALEAVQCGAKYIFVSWTELLRMSIFPSVERYNTKLYLCESGTVSDLGINPGLIIPGTYVENLKNRLFSLRHPHYELVKVLKYSKILNDLCESQNIKLWLLNSLMPMDLGYFMYVTNTDRKPSDTTSFTREILNASTRDDVEYFEIYDKIHLDYISTKWQDSKWLNIDQSYRKHFTVDFGTDGIHPGVESNRLFSNFILEKLKF